MPLKSTQHEMNKQLPVTEANENTFMAHVIIEQALHLPTVLGDNDARYWIRSIQYLYREKADWKSDVLNYYSINIGVTISRNVCPMCRDEKVEKSSKEDNPKMVKWANILSKDFCFY